MKYLFREMLQLRILIFLISELRIPDRQPSFTTGCLYAEIIFKNYILVMILMSMLLTLLFLFLLLVALRVERADPPRICNVISLPDSPSPGLVVCSNRYAT